MAETEGKSPEALFDLREKRLHLIRVAHITGERQAPVPGIGGGEGLLKLLLAASDHDDSVAAFQKRGRDCAPDARAAAGDQCDLGILTHDGALASSHTAARPGSRRGYHRFQ